MAAAHRRRGGSRARQACGPPTCTRRQPKVWVDSAWPLLTMICRRRGKRGGQAGGGAGRRMARQGEDLRAAQTLGIEVGTTARAVSAPHAPATPAQPTAAAAIPNHEKERTHIPAWEKHTKAQTTEQTRLTRAHTHTHTHTHTCSRQAAARQRRSSARTSIMSRAGPEGCTHSMHFCTTWFPFWSRTHRSVCSVSSRQMDTRCCCGSTCGPGVGVAGWGAARQEGVVRGPAECRTGCARVPERLARQTRLARSPPRPCQRTKP